MFFEYPKLLWLLAVPVLLILFYIYRELTGKIPYFTVSTIVPWSVKGSGIKRYTRHIPFVLRIIAISAMVVAIATMMVEAAKQKAMFCSEIGFAFQ